MCTTAARTPSPGRTRRSPGALSLRALSSTPPEEQDARMPLPRTITFGLSRNHAGANLAAWPAILTRAFSTGLGSPVELALADDYDQLLKQVLGGAVDVAWLPPLLH